VDVVRGCKCM